MSYHSETEKFSIIKENEQIDPNELDNTKTLGKSIKPNQTTILTKDTELKQSNTSPAKETYFQNRKSYHTTTNKPEKKQTNQSNSPNLTK